MAVKHFEEAFQYVRFSEGLNRSSIRYGDRLKTYGQLDWLPTKSKDVVIGYQKRGSGQGMELGFYIFFHDKCVGQVAFDYRDAPRELMRLFKGRKLAVPHVGVLPELRGLGYPSAIYGLALKKGTVLVSDHHTVAASTLWEAVARKFKAHLEYATQDDDTGKWRLVPKEMTHDDWKVMYL